jgi:hypothetical protein
MWKNFFKEDCHIIVNRVKYIFESEILPNIPYVGGKHNVNDTNNIVGCCEYAALFLVGRDYNFQFSEVSFLH